MPTIIAADRYTWTVTDVPEVGLEIEFSQKEDGAFEFIHTSRSSQRWDDVLMTISELLLSLATYEGIPEDKINYIVVDALRGCSDNLEM